MLIAHAVQFCYLHFVVWVVWGEVRRLDAATLSGGHLSLLCHHIIIIITIFTTIIIIIIIITCLQVAWNPFLVTLWSLLNLTVILLPLLITYTSSSSSSSSTSSPSRARWSHTSWSAGGCPCPELRNVESQVSCPQHCCCWYLWLRRSRSWSHLQSQSRRRWARSWLRPPPGNVKQI